MENIDTYLPFYLGCECIIQNRDNFKDVADELEPQLSAYVQKQFEETKRVILTRHILAFFKPEYITPILRRLPDITKEEVADLLGVEGFIQQGNYEAPFFQVEWRGLDEIERLKHAFIHQLNPTQVLFLLNKHFDLFGLIDAGRAIDKANNNLTEQLQSDEETSQPMIKEITPTPPKRFKVNHDEIIERHFRPHSWMVAKDDWSNKKYINVKPFKEGVKPVLIDLIDECCNLGISQQKKILKAVKTELEMRIEHYGQADVFNDEITQEAKNSHIYGLNEALNIVNIALKDKSVPTTK